VNNNYSSNTVVKQDFAVVKKVDGRAAHMTDTTRHQSWQSTPPPLPDHAESIPGINYYNLAIEKDRDSILTAITTIWNPGFTKENKTTFLNRHSRLTRYTQVHLSRKVGGYNRLRQEGYNSLVIYNSAVTLKANLTSVLRLTNQYTVDNKIQMS
jgi:hypothetical protein